MKRKILTALIALVCLCALTVLTSCGPILDLIFGSTTPPEPQHVHNMEQKTYSGSICSGQNEITYYKCTDCGKCYLDKSGNEQIDESNLGAGHLYTLKHDDKEHYRLCALCNAEQEGSRSAHSAEHYSYTATEHYKQCEVCDVVFDRGNHVSDSACDVCGRQADYKAMCNSRYGYEQLSTFGERSVNMKKLYNKIDEVVANAHDNANVNAEYGLMGTAQDGSKVNAYLLKLNCTDCTVYENEVLVTVATYRNDNPLYYWIDRQVGRSSVDGLVSEIRISVVDEYANGSARIAENNRIYSEIDKYLSYISAETDPYVITLALHDRIIENINYAYEKDGVTPEDDAWAHCIAGVFIHKTAVCEGYAKAFQLLLNACKINNAYVTGTSKGEGHAWNIVQLANDSWYWYDLTWDDQPNRARGVIYDYFCKPASGFADNHTVSAIKSGMNYQYDLPSAAEEDYQTAGLELDETFTKDGFTYKLVGYNRLAVDKCLSVGKDGIAKIPATVEQGGTTYKVTQINDEAFATYTRNIKGEIVSIVHPSVTKIVIPDTVDLIYNKSFVDCKSLEKIELVNLEGWERYPLNGQKPIYEQISANELSNESTACSLLRELCKDEGNTNYYCIWINVGD